jgi:hypothetical protein
MVLGCTAGRYVKFDTFHPAVNKGLPVTRVISRVTLQQILAKATERIAGADVICNDCHVVDYQEKVGHFLLCASGMSWVMADSLDAAYTCIYDTPASAQSAQLAI